MVKGRCFSRSQRCCPGGETTRQNGRPSARGLWPIHYFELPELFMEFICSMTGKSPSTTGAGSEGALTKGPFNALPPIIDLNNALVSWLLTGHQGFVTAAGYVGPRVRVDHDVSLLMPEVWCRMTPEERDPKFLIDNQYLERCADFDFNGKRVLASRLGYELPPASFKLSSAAFSIIRIPSSPRKCSAPNCRTWKRSRTAWTTSW